jgi:hypothetical protein
MNETTKSNQEEGSGAATSQRQNGNNFLLYSSAP